MNKRKRSQSIAREDKKIRLSDPKKLDLHKLALHLREIDDLQALRQINHAVSVTNHHLIYATFADDSEHIIAINENNLSVFDGQKLVGSLRAELPINYPLSNLNKRFGDTCMCTIKTPSEIEFYAPDNTGNKIILKNILDRKNTFYFVVELGEQQMRKHKKDLNDLIDIALTPACRSFLKNTFNFESYYDKKISKRSDDILIIDLLRICPALTETHKSTGGTPCETFVCDPKNNHWYLTSDLELGEFLVQKLLAFIPSLSCEEYVYIRTEANRKGFRNIFKIKTKHAGFRDLLGINKNVFPIGHQVVCHDSGRLRLTTPRDYVLAYADWTYSRELADQYREELSQMLEKIFPVKSEREYFLAFKASLLHGYRQHRCFLVFTDKRIGSNGKSTSFKMDRNFFGPFYVSNTKFVCRGSHEQDRNSHDAGSENMRGVRLVGADELKKNNRLDENWLKALTSNDFDVTGRKIYTSQLFKYEWQAGIQLAFNEGDCPLFDAADGAFMERMRVIPMRSKFVAGLEKDEPETLTFRMDHDLYQKLPLYNSALLDLLLEHRDEAVLDNAPESMQEWKDELCAVQNPLFEWLDDHLERIDEFREGNNDPANYISISDLHSHYASDAQNRSISAMKFVDLAKVVLRLRNIQFVEKKVFRIGSKLITKRKTIPGYKFKV